MSSIKQLALGVLVVCGFSMLFVAPVRAEYQAFPDVCNGDASDSTVCQDKGKNEKNPIAETIGNITKIVSFLAAVAAIFFIMFGGFRFITSNGDPAKAASGRQTVLYALAGLVVIALSQTLILFVVNRL